MEVRQACGVDPESVLAVEVKPVVGASAAADAAAAAAGQQKSQADFAAAEESGAAAHSAASEHLEDDPVSAAVMSGPGIGSAAAAEPVDEAHSSVGGPVGGAWPGLLVDSGFAVAVVSVGGPSSASVQFLPQAEEGIGGYEQAEEDLKCYEQHTTRYAGS